MIYNDFVMICNIYLYVTIVVIEVSINHPKSRLNEVTKLRSGDEHP